jgi:threonine dehydratase
MPVPLSAIRRAQEFLKQHLPQTRLVVAPSVSPPSGGKVYLKLETDLPTGSFKPRGALYALSVNLARRKVREVVASSTGNHGAAVAYAAKLLGVRATIFLPENPNPVKREKIAALGAKIVEHGPDLMEGFGLASAYAQAQPDVFFLNDATDPDLPAGPATIGCEIVDQLPEVDAIYVPMGDTALIRGVASAVRHLANKKVRIIGVQAERAPAYCLSWKRGEAVSTETCDTIADGLATRTPDAENVREIRELVDDVRLVSEQEMLGAIRHLLFEEYVAAEPSGAAATAVLLQANTDMRGHTVALVTGANVTPEVLRRAVNLLRGG